MKSSSITARQRPGGLSPQVGQLFWNSLLITGCAQLAERALCEAADFLDGCAETEGDSAYEAMMLACARSSLRVLEQADSAPESQSENGEPSLPDELRTLLQLTPPLRCCFVLHLLMGYTVAQIAGLMNLPGPEVQRLTRAAAVRLGQISYWRPAGHGDGAAALPGRPPRELRTGLSQHTIGI